jgi:hypothetical protein
MQIADCSFWLWKELLAAKTNVMKQYNAIKNVLIIFKKFQTGSIVVGWKRSKV